MITKLPEKVKSLLPKNSEILSVTPAGTSSFSSTQKVQTSTGNYFLKISPDKIALNGEFRGLLAIDNAVPGFCPKPIGYGEHLDECYLITEFAEMSGTGKEDLFAECLAKLHSKPCDLFGFEVPTCCGSTVQDNSWRRSWVEFFGQQRILSICDSIGDDKIKKLGKELVEKVVARLLGQLDVKPVLIHGDLWAGNKSVSKSHPVIFDPSAFYGHNEYELGIMRMFGGFSPSFYAKYHSIIPKSHPVSEYHDRIELYELYHHLNHTFIFGGSYRAGAIQLMQKLIAKYN